MRNLLCILIIAMSLVGCDGTRTRLNTGSDLAWYSADAAWMKQHSDGIMDWGQYNPANGDITIWDGLSGMTLVNVSCEELWHAADHQKPSSLWELIRRYQTPLDPSFMRIAHTPEDLAMTIAKLSSLPPPNTRPSSTFTPAKDTK